MADVWIIGSGPAGVSAALYTARAGLHTTIISMGTGALEKLRSFKITMALLPPLPGRRWPRQG